jgi:Alginate lyase
MRIPRIIITAIALTASIAPAADFSFIHPGLLDTAADLARMKSAVATRQEPIYSGFEVLRRHIESQPDYLMKGPRTSVGRGAGWTGPPQTIYDQDANAAYQCAILWAITGDRAYADKSLQIINAWSGMLQTIGGRDAVLGAGLGPFKMVNAAEIMRYTNAGWSDADIARTENCFRHAIYPVIKDFAPFANGNWDTAADKTMLAIAVFCNDRAMFERALRYYVHGQGNGRLTYYIINDDGECQESGRDQQHTQLGLAHLGDACEIAWNQGLDLYGYANNRLLKGFEYTAAYNLTGSAPFQPWLDRTGDARYLQISPPGRLRAVYEEIFNHYVNRTNLPAPQTERAAEKIRPEGQGVPGPQGITGADHPGFGTLLFTRPKSTAPLTSPFGVPAAPAGMIAEYSHDAVQLSWIAPIAAETYTVKRASNPGGPFPIIADGVATSHFTDQTANTGNVYYYTVSAQNAAGSSADAYETAICAGLPAPWQHTDIGPVPTPGDSQFDGQTFTLEGGGANIGGAQDQCQFAYIPMSGDGTIAVRHVPQVTSQHLQFGLMLRDTTSPDSAEVAFLIQRNGPGRWTTVFLTRPTAGSPAQESSIQSLTAPTITENRLLAPCWLRLSRSSDQFTASFSTDGQTWSPRGTIAASLNSHLLAGLAACSRLTGLNAPTTTVMFDHVFISR